MATSRQERRAGPVLSTDAGTRLEQFLIAAVSTVLVVRLFLHLTGYPQVGGHGLHIAHLLWGGLLLLVAFVMRQAYLGRRIKAIAAFVGGIGFGLFIDEIGKFVTSDNNYFYQPAVALIYAVFVVLFLVFRAIESRQRLTPTSSLVNALDVTKDAVLHQWTTDDRDRALFLLQHSDQDDPLVASLRGTLEEIPAKSAHPTWWRRIAGDMEIAYKRFVRDPRFFQVVQVVCALKIVAPFVTVFGMFSDYGSKLTSYSDSSFVTWVDTAAAIVEAALVIVGFLELKRRSRLAGYIRFKQATLVSIFIGSFLSFYMEQFWGLADLIFNLVILSALEYAIIQERRELLKRHGEDPASAADVSPETSPAGMKPAS